MRIIEADKFVLRTEIQNGTLGGLDFVQFFGVDHNIEVAIVAVGRAGYVAQFVAGFIENARHFGQAHFHFSRRKALLAQKFRQLLASCRQQIQNFLVALAVCVHARIPRRAVGLEVFLRQTFYGNRPRLAQILKLHAQNKRRSHQSQCQQYAQNR